MERLRLVKTSTGLLRLRLTRESRERDRNHMNVQCSPMANKDRRPESCREWWIIDRIRMSGRTVVGLADGERPRVFPAA
jgi:hypothetical protein